MLTINGFNIISNDKLCCTLGRDINQSSKIINELKNFEFRSICPIVEETELKYYSESINWQISREKYFDFSAVFSLRKILKNFNKAVIFIFLH